jgi:hypothetical protein
VSLSDRWSAPAAAEVHVLHAAARAAEDAGDLLGALRLVRRLPPALAGPRWTAELESAAVVSAEGSAAFACWLIRPALRWALAHPAGELLERYACLLLTTLGVPIAERRRRAGEVAATDPVVVDAALWDGDLLRRYLAEAASAGVLARAGPVEQWPEQPFSVWRYDGAATRGVRLTALADDAQVSCLGWEGPSPAAGDLLYGRLLPVEGAVPLAFAVAPTVVDRRCASRLLRAFQRRSGPEERILAVARSRRRAQA